MALKDYNYALKYFLPIVLLALSFCVGVSEPTDVALPCHKQHDEANTANSAMSDTIATKLQELYKSIEKGADYEEPCTHSVTFRRQSVEVVTLLESFELRLENYKAGLWGYCAKEGAEDLLKKIEELKKVAPDIVMCNRSKLLNCHEKYERCQCLVDNRNFRNIASEFWNNTEQSEDDNQKDLFSNQCILVSGSDCPLNGRFLCVPGTNCLFKDTLNYCVHHNKKEAMSRHEVSRYKRQTETETSGNSSEGEGRAGIEGSPDDSAYAIIRPDYPSVYCQCIGYERRISKNPEHEPESASAYNTPNMIVITSIFGITLLQ